MNKKKETILIKLINTIYNEDFEVENILINCTISYQEILGKEPISNFIFNSFLFDNINIVNYLKDKIIIDETNEEYINSVIRSIEENIIHWFSIHGYSKAIQNKELIIDYFEY